MKAKEFASEVIRKIKEKGHKIFIYNSKKKLL